MTFRLYEYSPLKYLDPSVLWLCPGQEIWVCTLASLGGLPSIGRGYVGPSLRLSFHFYYSTFFGV